MKLSLLAFLILLAVAVAATWMSLRWGRSSEGRRPGRRHWITRLICGLLGSAIVVALAVVTIRDARKPYTEPIPAEIRLPTLPLPDLSRETGELKKGRFLLHAVIVSWHDGAMVPLHGRTFDVRWPRDRNRTFRSSVESGGVRITFDVALSAISRHQTPSGIVVDYRGHRNVHASGTNFSSSRGGGVEFPESDGFSLGGGQTGPFSLVRSSSDSGAILLDLIPIQEEDPLRPGTNEDVLAIRGRGWWMKTVDDAVTTRSFWAASGSPAEELSKALQVNLLILLAAVILFAQLFRRRSIGLVKVAACLLLYVGALDRITLRIHESRLNDAAAPVEQRLVACSHLPSTIFFRKTALRDLEQAAADPSSPESLKTLAGRIAERGRRNHFP